MGRQSSRLYFQGKDHKDIYYNGHWHDEMYLSDDEGKVALTWKKLKGKLIPYISMLSYVNGKYYLVAESSKDPSVSGYPVLYTGSSLTRMKNRGLIFGDNPIRGYYYVMHAYLDKLIIIKTRDISEKHVAVIPIVNGEADMKNIRYELDTFEYSGYAPSTQSSEYVYKGRNYYYCKSNALYKNDTEIPSDASFADIFIDSDRLIAIGGLVRHHISADIPAFQFGIFNDENNTVKLKEVSLEPIITDLQDNEREKTIETLKARYEDYRYISESIETIQASSDAGEKFNSYFISGNWGYKTVWIEVKLKFTGRYKVVEDSYILTTDDVRYHAYYRVAIDLSNLLIKKYLQIIDNNWIYIISQVTDPKNNSQIVRNSKKNLTALNWEVLGQDYAEDNDIYIDPGLSIRKMVSLSKNGNELIVGVRGMLLNNFFIADTDNGITNLGTLEAYEE